LEAPLHIGMAPAGILNRTRLYVPGRAIWGVVTAELARRHASASSNSNAEPEYRQIGRRVQDYARFTYLFPAERVDGNWYAWLPEYHQRKGLMWVREDGDRVDDRAFRFRLLSTRPGTAISRDSATAADGTLHEVECIQPFWRKPSFSTFHPVAMVGYVFCKNGHNLSHELKAIDLAWIGADTRYGLGRLVRLGGLEPEHRVFGSGVDLSDVPRVEAKRLMAHANALIDDPKLEVEGNLELLVRWDEGGPVAVERPLWVPGSRLNTKAWWLVKEDATWELTAE